MVLRSSVHNPGTIIQFGDPSFVKESDILSVGLHFLFLEIFSLCMSKNGGISTSSLKSLIKIFLSSISFV